MDVFPETPSYQAENGQSVFTLTRSETPNNIYCQTNIPAEQNPVQLTIQITRECIVFIQGSKHLPCKFKADNKNVNFPTQFCLGSICNGFSAAECREVSLNGNVYDFSVGHNSIDKSYIVDINKYLITKNNIKQCLSCLLNC